MNFLKECTSSDPLLYVGYLRTATIPCRITFSRPSMSNTPQVQRLEFAFRFSIDLTQKFAGALKITNLIKINDCRRSPEQSRRFINFGMVGELSIVSILLGESTTRTWRLLQ
jgi:hypothetical protein